MISRATRAFLSSITIAIVASQAICAEAPKLPTVPASVIEVVKEAPLTRYGRTLKGGAHTNGGWSEGWQVAAAVAAWQGRTDVDAKLLEQIDYVLQGENCFSANGGYPAQHELTMTATFAILRQSDRFWSTVLTSEQRHKIDLLMRAVLIASAYTTSDATYAPGKTVTALDGDKNLNRGWNPNFQEGMFGNLIAATVYFGGADKGIQILKSYDHEAFVAELTSAGLTNTAETFNWAKSHPDSGAPTAEQIEASVRNYQYDGQPLLAPFEAYVRLTQNTYGKNVMAGLNDGAGIVQNGVAAGTIASGAEGLPNIGKLGMLTEFDSMDGNGHRSSMTYAYDGFRPNLANHAVVVVGGYWHPGEVADGLLARMDVGITDLLYKLEHGYRSYAKGKGHADVFSIKQAHWDYSFRTTIPLWTDVLRPYHLPRSKPVGKE